MYEISDDRIYLKGKDVTDTILRTTFNWFLKQIENGDFEYFSIGFDDTPFILKMENGDINKDE